MSEFESQSGQLFLNRFAETWLPPDFGVSRFDVSLEVSTAKVAWGKGYGFLFTRPIPELS
jgi:hypothetical protein